MFAAKRTIEFIDRSDAAEGAEENRRGFAMRSAEREIQGRCRSAHIFSCEEI